MSEVNVRLTAARQAAQDAHKRILDAQKVMADAIKDAINEGMNGIFDTYPFLGSVHWTQYTPYFNDGDPCVFHANFYPGINSVKDIEDGTDSFYSEENGEDFASKSDKQIYVGHNPQTYRGNYEDNPNYDAAYEECSKEVDALFKSLTEDDDNSGYDQSSPLDLALLQAFGDHVKVAVSRDGIEVDDYEHE